VVNVIRKSTILIEEPSRLQIASPNKFPQMHCISWPSGFFINIITTTISNAAGELTTDISGATSSAPQPVIQKKGACNEAHPLSG
jgi:hypothetical protein